MLRFLNSILFFLLMSATVLAQSKDSTVRKDFLPTGVRLGTDVISLIRTQTDESFSGYEINADVDFYRYFLTIDAGRWERNFSADEEDYNNSGNYFRVGVDINFLKKDPEKNMFFFGMRYGQSKFSENLHVTSDPVWGPVNINYTNEDKKAGWGELTTGIRVKMWKFFWMGYTARFKFGLSMNGSNEFATYDVPGYGKTTKESTWGFNYQLLFRIPVRTPGPPQMKPIKKKPASEKSTKKVATEVQ